MSLSESETYSFLSKVTEIQNPLHLVQEIDKREEEFRKIQGEIKMLYNDCQKENVCPIYKEVAKDMITNLTDGRFEEFYKTKPQFLNTVDVNVNEMIKHVERAKNELEQFSAKVEYNKDELMKIISNVGNPKTRVAMQDIVGECINSLDKFQSTFGKESVANEISYGSNKRDLLFEGDLSTFISNVKDFQKVLNSRKIISDMTTQNKSIQECSSDPVTASLHMDIISGLLKDVERLNYSEPDS